MMNLLLLFTPAAVGLFVIHCKLPDDMKDVIFSCPTWLTSTLISVFIGKHTGHGVMAPYATMFSEIFLFPGMEICKHIHNKKRMARGLDPIKAVGIKEAVGNLKGLIDTRKSSSKVKVGKVVPA